MKQISFLFLLLFVLGMAAPAQSDSVQTHEKLNPSPTPRPLFLTLPGVDPKIRYSALQKAIFQIGDSYGFPVELLKRSMELEIHGRKFSPHRWSFWREKFESSFSRTRISMLEKTELPVFIALDLPGLGPQVYDADVIRALINTPLFPYNTKIVRTRINGVSTAFVLLDKREADAVRSCFADIAKTGKGPCSQSMRMLGADLSAAPRSFVRLVSYDKEQTTTVPDLNNPKPLAYLPVEDEAAKLVEEVSCGDRERFGWNQEEKKELDSHQGGTACIFKFHLTLPRRTASSYSEIAITAQLEPSDNKGFYLSCGPSDSHLQVPVTSETLVAANPCKPDSISWELSGQILSHPAGPQSFEIFLVQDSTDRPKLKLELKGVRQPFWRAWLSKVEVGNWCFPKGCI